jgi:DNA polymerase III delta prime subunit
LDRRPPDPFAIQADPSLYVPRRATEEVLDELERALASAPHGAVCFSGPPGIGKSLLLRVLAAELAERYRTAYLPYARLPAGGLWMCVATELGLEAGRDPKRAVRRLLAELAAARRALLLEIDDASSLPAETLYDLLAFARSEANLRVLLTYSESESLPGPVPEDLAVVRLEAPMSRSETQDYVKARLAASSAPRSLADRFDSATVARLHRDSAGNPLRLHGLAVAVARGAAPSGAPLSAAPAEPPRRAERAPEPTEALPPPALPAARPRRGSRALAGPAWAIAGLCVGLAASLAVGEWRARRGREPAPAALAEAAAPPGAAPAPPREAPRAETTKPAAAAPVDVAASPPPSAAPPPSPEASPPVSAPPPALPRAALPEPPPEAGAALRALENAIAAPAPVPVPAPAPERVSPREAAEAAQAESAAEREAARAAPQAPSAPAVSAAPPVARDLTARESAPAAPAPAAPAPRATRTDAASLAPGRLDVSAEAQVEIEIDGRHFGPPPLVGIRLSRGEHRVIAHYADGGSGMKTIVLGDADVSITFR